MSALEQRELQELGLTPEQLKSKQQALASVTAPQANGRKRRSDAGTHRPKPEGRIIIVRFSVTTDKQAQTYAKALRVFLDAGDTANVDAMLAAAMRG